MLVPEQAEAEEVDSDDTPVEEIKASLKLPRYLFLHSSVLCHCY
ncbi:hypothetical protein [Nostoc sp. 'Peltigera membranacea cyanobiont' 213]|nr:hypothetical protein [Nostoc sp. 'Peltigera membranacea cyanobiont' 213]